ncbi:MAG: glycosyltransferase family 2 protein [Alphaproteobacteria bacterium]
MMKIIVFGIGFIIGFLAVYTERPAVSVVMGTYNRADMLPKAIDSVLAQTYGDFEFIIINDGSTDSTAQVLADYEKKDKRIRVLTNEKNQGLVYSLNLGLDAARGKYIARMDDDDVSRPERFAKQKDYMDTHKAIAVVSSWVAKPGTNTAWSFQRELNPEKIKALLYANAVPISHPASFMRRSFLNEHHIRYNAAYPAAEDRKFWLDVLDAGGKIGNIPDLLLEFRVHNTNPISYYIQQGENSRKFFINDITMRFGEKEEFKDLSHCDILKKIALKNKDKKLVSVKVYDEVVEQACSDVRAEKSFHPHWGQDAFIFKKNRVCRELKASECARVLSRTAERLTVKWDRWGEETFVKKNNQWVLEEP